jgi:hypothetical protein
MRILYLEPHHGLGNRLIMILSALRICRRVGYSLQVIWRNNMAGEASEFHYFAPLDTYFCIDAIFISHLPPGINVHIPKYLSEDRSIIDETTFDGQNVYISGWTHFLLLPQDLTETGKIQFTIELQQIASVSLRPMSLLQEWINRCYPLDDKSVGPFFLLGVHLRGGGHLGGGPLGTNPGLTNNIPNLKTVLDNLDRLLPSSNGSDSVFVGGAPSQLSEVRKFVESKGFKVYSDPNFAQIKTQDYFTSEPTLQSDLNACRDFYLLMKCINVFTSFETTFGNFAAILGGADRYVTYQGKLVKMPPYALTGSGV